MTKTYADHIAKRKKETFYKKAKEMNLRARSYFKLEQVDKKYKLIHNNSKILDLGCAPGGWLQYIDSKIEIGEIIGIDLLDVKKQHEFSKNITIIEDDFNNIEDYNLGKFDLIVSDMAPEFSGKPAMDKGKTHKLNILTIDFAAIHLKKGGNLLFKSFEGEDLDHVRNIARKNFKYIKEFKPQSSQQKSAETFIVGFSRK